jgi:hypothetical protein
MRKLKATGFFSGKTVVMVTRGTKFVGGIEENGSQSNAAYCIR